MQIILAEPRGFCAGVRRAIDIVEKSLAKYGAPVFVRHEIVHNKYVVDDLKKKGAIFVEELSEIPAGAVTIFSAHGVAEIVENEAKERGLSTLDATCPLVTKVHKEAQKRESEHRQVILIGHKNHVEVIGTAGRVKAGVILVSNKDDVANINVKDPNLLAYVTQTTLSVDDTKEIIEALKVRFPNIVGPDIKDICYATQNRQTAVKQLAEVCDVILVIGAVNSSNSNRLKDVGLEKGIKSYLINDYTEIDLKWIEKAKKVGITAGASAPEILVDQVIDYLKDNFNASVTLLEGIIENVHFKLPKELINK